MKLHVFNPEHEMALASNLHQFTSPKAGREMRSHLSYLPALWADDGDGVWVDDVGKANDFIKQIDCDRADVRFVSSEEIPHIEVEQICPWGWDRSLVHQLRRLQVSENILPTDIQLSKIREISSRQWASQHLLPSLSTIENSLVGEATYYTSLPSFVSPVVMKSPWSCSGRGVRYALTEQDYLKHEKWARNVIDRQGGIMVEPYYERLLDFAMEFESTAQGINYLGISLFLTHQGGYTGNVIASEEYKLLMISRFIPVALLEKVKNMILEKTKSLFPPIYQGSFGVDMMVVVNENYAYQLHPCVELNLRRTMGHVSLSIKPKSNAPMTMSVNYDGVYRLALKPLEKQMW